jgi:hypothetical protein
MFIYVCNLCKSWCILHKKFSIWAGALFPKTPEKALQYIAILAANNRTEKIKAHFKARVWYTSKGIRPNMIQKSFTVNQTS